MSTPIQVIVNGESREVPSAITVDALLGHLGLRRDRVAIEKNLEILPRAQWTSAIVQAGDQYEIVQLVGGG